MEFRLAVKALGANASDQVCDAVFREFDANGSGSVDYREYVLMLLRDMLQRSTRHLVETFRQWDTNDDGSVSRAEFRRGILAAGFDASPTDIDAIFDDIDLDSSGRIDYQEIHARLRQGTSFGASASPGDGLRTPRGSPSAQPLSTRSRWTSADHFTGSSPNARDRRQGRAVSAHLERMAASRG